MKQLQETRFSDTKAKEYQDVTWYLRLLLVTTEVEIRHLARMPFAGHP